MIRVQGGTFMMGSLPEEEGRINDGSEDTVTISVGDFYMSKYEVTETQFKKIFSDYKPQYLMSCDSLCPVGYISWWRAVQFCNALSEAAGLKPYYLDGKEGEVIENKNSNGYRLPTEAEWEYAAKGGQNATIDYIKHLDTIAWNKNNTTQCQPIGTKLGNALGLHDMLGNLWEWCFDEQNFPPYTELGYKYKIIKGGAYKSSIAYCRPAASYAMLDLHPEVIVGIRLVKNIKQ